MCVSYWWRLIHELFLRIINTNIVIKIKLAHINTLVFLSKKPLLKQVQDYPDGPVQLLPALLSWRFKHLPVLLILQIPDKAVKHI